MYSEIKIYGNCDLNYVISKTSDDDIAFFQEAGICSPSWDGDTYFLVNFNDNLNGGEEALKGLTGYYIYRQVKGSNAHHLIDAVDSDCTCIKDYSVQNLTSYQYFIVPIKQSDEAEVFSEEIESGEIDVRHIAASIVGLTPSGTKNVYTVEASDVWNFSLNIAFDDFKPQYNKTTINTLGQFPKVYGDDTAYLTGGGSFLFGSLSCENKSYVSDDIDKINKWVAFCNNGLPKLFRDSKGHIILCEITDTSYNYDGSATEMPTTVSFSFTQIGDASNISAYRKEV